MSSEPKRSEMGPGRTRPDEPGWERHPKSYTPTSKHRNTLTPVLFSLGLEPCITRARSEGLAVKAILRHACPMMAGAFWWAILLGLVPPSPSYLSVRGHLRGLSSFKGTDRYKLTACRHGRTQINTPPRRKARLIIWDFDAPKRPDWTIPSAVTSKSMHAKLCSFGYGTPCLTPTDKE